jgi:hypothetical protein
MSFPGRLELLQKISGYVLVFITISDNQHRIQMSYGYRVVVVYVTILEVGTQI